MTDVITNAPAVIILAAGDSVAFRIGEMLIPFTGVILVIVGVIYLIRDGRLKRPPSAPPQWYPPQQGWPQPGYPPAAQPYSNQWHEPLPAHYPRPYSAGPLLPTVPKSSNYKTGTVLLAIGGLILFSTVVTAVGQVGQSDSASPAHPTRNPVAGQCYTDTEAFGGSFAPLDCSDPNAVIEVVSRSDDGECPDGKKGADSQYSSTTDGTTTYCMIPNLQQGRCYAGDSASKVLELDDYAGHRSTKVTTRVDDSIDTSACAGSAKSVVFPRPPRVYCLDQS